MPPTDATEPPSRKEWTELRILIVSDSYPPLIGGATKSAQQLARHLVDRGHVVSVATTWQPQLPIEERDGAVQIYRLRGLMSRVPGVSSNPHRQTPPPFPDPESVWRFRRLITRLNPELIHTYGWISYSCLVALVGKNVPVILSARDYGNVCAVRTLVRKGEICDGPGWAKCLDCASSFYGPPKGIVSVVGTLSGRWLLRRKVNGLHTISAYVREVMKRHLVGQRPWAEAVIPSFRDEVEAGTPDAATLALLPSEPFILFVGALRSVKGIHELLEAYQSLSPAPPLVLIGTRAPDSPTAFPSGVTVLYDVPRATVMAAWDRALFGVAPSRWAEPMGNVVHEGMSRGKPVIGTTPGGHVDMIGRDEAGLLVPAGDAPALAAAMRRLINDTDLRDQLGQAARRRSYQFTAAAAIPQFEELYERVVVATRRQ